VRPGDWTCPNCGANVYASKTKCYRCQTLKPGFQQGGAPVNDKIDVRPGDWTCDNCGANVFATKMACYKCQAPKPLRYMGNTMMGGFVGAGGEGAARGGDVRPGDWTCSNCGANVYATKTNCYRCQAPKPLAPEIVPAYGASFGGLGSFGGWSGGGGGFRGGGAAFQSGGYGGGGFGVCGGYGNSQMGGAMKPLGGGGDIRPGDWTCPNCGANCYASKEICYRCRTAKPADAYNAAPAGGGGGGGFGGSGMSGDVRPGDWTCPNCGANVYASKTNCYRCHTAKPEGGNGGDASS